MCVRYNIHSKSNQASSWLLFYHFQKMSGSKRVHGNTIQYYPPPGYARIFLSPAAPTNYVEKCLATQTNILGHNDVFIMWLGVLEEKMKKRGRQEKKKEKGNVSKKKVEEKNKQMEENAKKKTVKSCSDNVNPRNSKWLNDSSVSPACEWRWWGTSADWRMW